VLPDVPGVPRLRARVDEVAQIPDVVSRFLPEVRADPRLLAMSFADPLRLATDVLGIAVSPVVARAVRAGLRGLVSFDLAVLDDNGRLRGIDSARWWAKPKVGVPGSAVEAGDVTRPIRL
jgi:hypothetical protein